MGRVGITAVHQHGLLARGDLHYQGYARKVCGENRVVDIIDGLHLLSPEPERIWQTGECLRDLHFTSLHVCHCTSLAAKIALARSCPLQEVGAGIPLEG